MKLQPRTRRVGFTLIELLVVIAIIAILVSLLLAGIFYAYNVMYRTGAGSDMSQLSVSLQSFKSQYKIYPPDQIRLCSNRNQYFKNGTDPLDAASLQVIDRMWPNIGVFTNQDWSGHGFNGNNLNVVVNEVLDGDQCLVFFLGGVPLPSGGLFSFTGFSTDPKNPGQLPATTGNVGRVPTFYNFPASRVILRRDPNNNKNAPNNFKSANFPSYWDYYQNSTVLPSGVSEPAGFYLYFSANNVKNGYNAFYPQNYIYGITVYNNLPTGAAGGTWTTVQAYYQVAPVVNGGVQTSRGQYYAPDTFQIVCAGRDGNFGPGGLWTAASPPSLPGQDDLGSFNSNRVLAAPQ